ncbi:DUF6934 family protein [Dyadobacter luticola]|uniref:Uncharacterized protein n=1 Tax=Dyadobacter luticola TaxID=1979387 RepID=A0A5R9KXT6_9BACT|nr:hypothetical protein [Dyadobacter luticola]TLV01083.1 hypothetical protein FEN17_16645 [Dyadobacter luticola]
MFGTIVTHASQPLFMQEISYPFALVRHELRYEFVSVSERRKITKVVLITKSADDRIFNLALLDESENFELSDISESNNGDLKNVLATVFKIIDHFLNVHTTSVISFRGSDERRQRLYRIAISRELAAISERFVILGMNRGNISLYEVDRDYDFYLIRKRI